MMLNHGKDSSMIISLLTHKKILPLILSVFLLLLTAAGCGKGGATGSSGNAAVIDREAYSVKDDAGRTVTLKSNPNESCP